MFHFCIQCKRYIDGSRSVDHINYSLVILVSRQRQSDGYHQTWWTSEKRLEEVQQGNPNQWCCDDIYQNEGDLLELKLCEVVVKLTLNLCQNFENYGCYIAKWLDKITGKG